MVSIGWWVGDYQWVTLCVGRWMCPLLYQWVGDFVSGQVSG